MVIGLLVAMLAAPVHAQVRKVGAEQPKAGQVKKQAPKTKRVVAPPAVSAAPAQAPVYDTEKAMR